MKDITMNEIVKKYGMVFDANKVTSGVDGYYIDCILVNRKKSQKLIDTVVNLVNKYALENFLHPTTSQPIKTVEVDLGIYRENVLSERKFVKSIAVRKEGADRSSAENYETIPMEVGQVESSTTASIRYGYIDFFPYNDDTTLINIQANLRAYEMFPKLSDMMFNIAVTLSRVLSAECIYIMSDSRTLSNNAFAYITEGVVQEEKYGRYVQERHGTTLIFDYLRRVFGINISDVTDTIVNREDAKFVKEDLEYFENQARIRGELLPYYYGEKEVPNDLTEEANAIFSEQLKELGEIMNKLQRLYKIMENNQKSKDNDENIFSTYYFRFEVI